MELYIYIVNSKRGNAILNMVRIEDLRFKATLGNFYWATAPPAGSSDCVGPLAGLEPNGPVDITHDPRRS